MNHLRAGLANVRTARPLFVACLALGCVIVVVSLTRPPLPVPAVQRPDAAPAEPAPTLPLAPLPDSVAAEKPRLPQPPAPAPTSQEASKAQQRSALTPNPAAASPAPKRKKETLDPMARSALSFVGADPDAEAYWYAAINDPRLSASERQDLIEDLNEDGLSDPRRPDIEDLPLILNRLALIEMVAPDAMDQVNADAFQEAYKDLLNMVARLTQ